MSFDILFNGNKVDSVAVFTNAGVLTLDSTKQLLGFDDVDNLLGKYILKL